MSRNVFPRAAVQQACGKGPFYRSAMPPAYYAYPAAAYQSGHCCLTLHCLPDPERSVPRPSHTSWNPVREYPGTLLLLISVFTYPRRLRRGGRNCPHSRQWDLNPTYHKIIPYRYSTQAKPCETWAKTAYTMPKCLSALYTPSSSTLWVT